MDVDTETSSPPSPVAIGRLLIANRGEIAVRIARTAREMGIETIAVYSEDDHSSGHLRCADITHPLDGQGPGAYLNMEQIVAVARQYHCEAVHPGYGFLSENSGFAHLCKSAGLLFVGPAAETIALFGDKTRARELASSCGVAINSGSAGPASLADATAYLASLGPGDAMVIKAVAGGGGKGMRVVHSADEVAAAYQRCQSEANSAFGNGALFVERLIQRARHVEVQIVGDGEQVSHLWERECTLQRQHQKLLEVAPSPSLSNRQREHILDAAMRMAAATGYANVGTFEFLVDLDREGKEGEILFLEANPRLQVEHTITEEVLGLDLVRIQLELAAGHTLAELSLQQEMIPSPRGYAIQLRVNAETMDAEARSVPTGGTLDTFNPPGGPGVRVDTFACAGYETVVRFDSLLAKLIVNTHGADFTALLRRARRAIGEFEIAGLETNLSFLGKLLGHPAVAANEVTTDFIASHIGELLPPSERGAGEDAELVDSGYGDNLTTVTTPLYGVISVVKVSPGDVVQAGTELLLVEAMKLEHAICAPHAGTVIEVLAAAGATVQQGQAAVVVDSTGSVQDSGMATEELDLDAVREDLQLVRDRIGETLDEQRPQAVERRRSRGQRTARENIADLCDDDDGFIEYGQLAVAYLHARKSDEELRATTPADGFITGIGSVNGEHFGPGNAQVAVGCYDATVMAGTQGHKNHQKADRLFELAREHDIPLVLFAEGGGGRPREDPVTIAALENTNFRKLAELSGKVPILGIVSGRCFAGNAALLGLADVIIATENSNIGMAGPALVAAGGLGNFKPEDIGPIDVQHQNGVVDIRVEDEEAAVKAARQYLSYFQGAVSDWEAGDSRRLRHVIPQNRLRVYDARDVIELIADTDSVLELRDAFGKAYVTALIRVEGKPLGVIANNPRFNAGAIDSDSADKAARFLRLCDALGLPVLSLIDTPGIMVGPEAEQTGLVRHSARLFATTASLEVPIFAIVLRKAYGLGGAAAAGGHFKAPFFTIAWPTGELGGMGLEGAVQLAYNKELDAIEDPDERQAFFEERVASRYRKGKAVFIASYFELDAVIDPAESRAWIVKGLEATANSLRKGSGRFIDTW